MPKVFVSYAREDLNAVLALEQGIGQRVSLWRDQQKLYGGDRWPKVLGEAIDANDVVLLVWSQHSAASYYVEFEWCTALALRKCIIPWRLDETPLPPSLCTAHGLNARSGEAALVQLMKSLGRRLPATDTEQSAKVIAELGRITAKQPKAVVRKAKTIFNQHNWVVHGYVFKAARDQHITIQVPEKPQESPDLSLADLLLLQQEGLKEIASGVRKIAQSNRPILSYSYKYIPADHRNRGSFTQVVVLIENTGNEIAENVVTEIVIKDDERILANTSGEALRRGIPGSIINPGEHVGFPIFGLLEHSPDFSFEYDLLGSLALIDREFEVIVHSTYTDTDGIRKLDAGEFTLRFLWESYRGGGQARHIRSSVVRRNDQEL